MNFRVQKPFNLNGMVRMPGQIVELDFDRAARFRRMGLIGLVGPERATKPPTEQSVPQKPERAVKKPGEKRAYKKKEKEVPALEPQEPQEIAQNGAETDNTAGD